MPYMLQTILTSALGSPSEDVKAVASQALGGVAIGNLSTYLPFILQQIQSQVTFQSRCMLCYAACISQVQVQQLPICRRKYIRIVH